MLLNKTAKKYSGVIKK